MPDTKSGNRSRAGAKANPLPVSRSANAKEFVVSLAHELNQPLAAITVNGAAGLRWLAHEEPDLVELRDTIERIIFDTHRATQILRRVCEAATGRPPEVAHVSLNGIVRDAVACLNAEIEEHDATLNLHLCDDLPRVWADAVGLQEVIVNLVVNALQTMSEARAPSRRVTIRTERKAAGVVLAIEDEGPGIAEDHMTRIFDCFFTTRPSGSGMGLSISRSIVEDWSGRILAANVAGGGARFSVELKIAE